MELFMTKTLEFTIQSFFPMLRLCNLLEILSQFAAVEQQMQF